MDPRPVAAFRIALGALVFADLADRLRDYYAFYSDVAIFTPQPYAPAVFVLGFVAAVALAVGFKSRLALVGVCFVLASLQSRAYIVGDGSDSVLRAMSFWLLFANPGACWSLDARSSRPPPARTPPFALFILQLQIMLVYLCAGLWKYGPMWREGTAIYHVLQLETFRRDWVDVLLAHPQLCAAATWATLWIELSFAPLVFWPSRYTRWLAIGSVVALHIGIGATMKVGAFSFVMPATLVLFVPVDFVAPLRSRAAPLLASLFLFVVLSQVPLGTGTLAQSASSAMSRVLTPLGLRQHWPMFAPNPSHFNMRFSATDDDTGEDVLVEGLRVSKSPIYSRWTKVRYFLLGSDKLQDYAGLGRHMCWLHPGTRAFTMELAVEPTLGPDGTPSGQAFSGEVYHQPCR